MLSNLFRTLNWKVEELRKEWGAGNPLRLKYEAGPLGRAFHTACEHPLRWTAVWFVFALTLSFFAWIYPPPYLGPFDWQPNLGSDGRWNAVEPFVGLWAVQTAIVAVVYPIVVAFITILLQRQNASKASLHAYFSRSAAKLTGFSSLALVLLMAIQYVAMEKVGTLVPFAWIIGDSIWAAINIVLCIVFLHATFEFASVEGRKAARFEYVLTQAWPAEWEHHVKRLISYDPLKHGLIIGVSAVENLEGTEPAFSNPGDGLAREYTTHFAFRRERSVENIRYLLVQVVYWLWCRKALGTQPNVIESSGWKRVGPVFQLSVVYGERFAFDTPVAVTSGGKPLTKFQKILLRLSVSLSRRRVSPRVLVRDALEELRTDAALAIQANAEAEFRRQLLGLMELLDAVVEASGYTYEGKPNNWVQLIDSEYVGMSQELIWTWLRTFRDLHGVAINAIAVRDVFAAATVRFGSRLLQRQSKSLTDKLRQTYVQHQFLLLYDLLGWGAEGCASASSGDTNPGKLLDEPLRRRYDRVLREGLSAWESMKNYSLLPRGYDEQPNWGDSATAAETLGLHLRYHAQLVAHAMRADDRGGFEYFTDSLMKWVGQRDSFQADSGLEYGDRYRVTVSDLALPLTTFRARFPLPSYETEDVNSIRAVRRIALKNLWRDVVLTLVTSALNQVNSGMITKGLGARLVQHLIDGTPILEEGGPLQSSRPFESADRVLSALVRQLVEGISQEERYKERIDKVAESVGFSAMDRGISERVYSRVGSEIDYILDAQLLILARLAPANWKPGSLFENTMRGWAPEDDLRRQMLDQLRTWVERLKEGDFTTRYAWLWQEAGSVDGATLDEKISRARKGLEQLLERLKNLREKEIRETPIAETAKKRIALAAAKALEPPAKWCPLSLLNNHIKVDASVPQARGASFKLSGYDKGAMTDPPMAQLAANEEDSVRDITENVIALEVLKDVVYRSGVEERKVSNVDAWFEELRLWAKQCQAISLHSLAIFPSRADPPWLIDLVRKRIGETDEAAQVRKRSKFSEQRGYVGHFGEVALFTGPLPAGITALLTLEEFDALQIEKAGDQPFVVEAVPDKTKLRCTLTISWRHRLDGKHGPVLRLRHVPNDDN